MNRSYRIMSVVLLGLLLGSAAWGAGSGIFVATASSDFGTGSTALLPAGASTAQVDLLNIHSDARVRYFDGRIYVVNRMGQDNVIVLDPALPATPLAQYSVGNGTNPQDILVVSEDKAYVTLYERDHVLVIDPRDGSRRGTIDLSAYADADSLPELAQMARVGDRVFVAVQRLDRGAFWAPVGDSYLAVIDAEADTVVDADPSREGVQGISLTATNPGAMEAVGKQLFVQEVGDFMSLDGGIDVIDTETLQAQGLAVSEQQLGGQCQGLAMSSSRRGFTTVSSWPNYAVVPFDAIDGTVGEPLSGTSGGYIPSLVLDGDRLVVADRGTAENLRAAGLLVFDAASGALLQGPISTGLPPSSMAVLSDEPVSTAITGMAPALPVQDRLQAAYPNPFNSCTVVPFRIAESGTAVTLRVYDVLGRRIRTLYAGPATAGEHRFTWNGLDDDGRHVSSGAYVVELRTGRAAGARQTAKVLLLK